MVGVEHVNKKPKRIVSKTFGFWENRLIFFATISAPGYCGKGAGTISKKVFICTQLSKTLLHTFITLF